MSKKIQITRGYIVTVDEEDYDWLMRYGWCVHNNNRRIQYARATIRGKNILMHRKIMMHHNLLEDGLVVDHIDGNGLNNQKVNLRVCMHAENMRNRKGPFKNGYRGILKSRSKRNPWRAQIRVNGRPIHLGIFPTKEEAALAYDRAAYKYHGEFATLNFPLEREKGA